MIISWSQIEVPFFLQRKCMEKRNCYIIPQTLLRIIGDINLVAYQLLQNRRYNPMQRLLYIYSKYGHPGKPLHLSCILNTSISITRTLCWKRSNLTNTKQFSLLYCIDEFQTSQLAWAQRNQWHLCCSNLLEPCPKSGHFVVKNLLVFVFDFQNFTPVYFSPSILFLWHKTSPGLLTKLRNRI